jgi:hypothetical protein
MSRIRTHLLTTHRELFAGYNSGKAAGPSERPGYGTLASLEAEMEADEAEEEAGGVEEEESPDL